VYWCGSDNFLRGVGSGVTLPIHRNSDWRGVPVGVLGVGIAGFSAADALMQLGADVSIIDSSAGEKQRERADILGSLGAHIYLGASELPDTQFAFVVTSPGLPPDSFISCSSAGARHSYLG